MLTYIWYIQFGRHSTSKKAKRREKKHEAKKEGKLGKRVGERKGRGKRQLNLQEYT